MKKVVVGGEEKTAVVWGDFKKYCFVLGQKLWRNEKIEFVWLEIEDVHYL